MQQPPDRRNVLDRLQGCQGCFSTLIIFVIFLLLGGALSFWGWRILQDARASAAWPAVAGTVVDSGVLVSTDSDGGDSYTPQVTYQYQVDNEMYEDNTIKFGENTYGDRGRANEILAPYPVGQSVTVYYDPAHPDRSVLEPGVTAGSYLVVGLGVLFVLIALIVAPLTLALRNRS